MVELVHPDNIESQAEAIDRIVAAGAEPHAWPAQVRGDYREEIRERTRREGRFLLLLGLAVGFASCLVDILTSPHLAAEGFLLRALAVAPFTGLGLIAAARKNYGLLTFCISLSQLGFAAVLIHLAAHMPPADAAQYYLATALILGMSNVILPYSTRGLLAFDLTFILGIVGVLIMGGLPTIVDRADFLSVLVLVAAATLPIGQRFERLRQRNFLLSMRHRLASEELVEANRALRELSERDPLTGLHNRRYFEQAFREGCKTAPHRGNGYLLLLMIDLDHFKAFNDRHGHQAGDYCLKTVGKTLRTVFAEHGGLVARFGGEEFIGAVQVTGLRQAHALGETIRKSITDLPGHSEGAALVTASVGIAVVPIGQKLTLEDLIEMADSALYSAKRAGRNRVELIEAGEDFRRSA